MVDALIFLAAVVGTFTLLLLVALLGLILRVLYNPPDIRIVLDMADDDPEPWEHDGGGP